MRILVCGSRTWTDSMRVFEALIDYGCTTVIEGGARGADMAAREAADILQLNTECYLADWERLGRGAGPERNRRMLEQSNPDLVLAFWDGKSRGTKHMIEIAEKAGVPVIVNP